jgi:hypothetical protein
MSPKIKQVVPAIETQLYKLLLLTGEALFEPHHEI